ncbi:exodeoxyribonuclease VII small subunit [Desulfoglaeba alkanexedens]|uniref:Exodeoxyribonuclease 7 small subunit n=1 Tax=Desulfoglaeba alkanexedens ALDC TaxID=980445 RepID=A0A4P8L243_9BACT|nr:exodeoxyribonuclease VII small subunit [Desulfoglaeba alkanexedens]QCQ21957.1 exodeoxyribonuclease VII small subunit [Desulfoglaeba alkanexedens ALDC]
MARKKKTTEKFEEALKDLEKIVERLEKGDVPLEEAMEAFSEGVQLVRFCHQKLDEAEKTLQMLVKDQDDRWATAPFEPPKNEEENG